MLAPHEFIVGPISVAAGMTLVLPRSKYETTMLITAATEIATAVVLDGEFRFASLHSTGNTNWAGILVPNVSLEIDETSVIDPASGRPPGTLIRKQTQLFIVTQDRPGARSIFVPLVAGLPPCHENESAGFARWRLMIGEGLARRQLKTVDIMETPGSH